MRGWMEHVALRWELKSQPWGDVPLQADARWTAKPGPGQVRAAGRNKGTAP